MKHVISPLDLTLTELDDILTLAEEIIENPKKFSNVCHGKKLATLFYEPSTRTRLSFEAAMLKRSSFRKKLCLSSYKNCRFWKYP